MLRVDLTLPQEVTITFHGVLSPQQKSSLRLLIDQTSLEALTLIKEHTTGEQSQYVFRKATALTLGHDYHLVLEGLGTFPVHMHKALSFADFDETYTYQGDDLGAVYASDHTTFKLWAPLASQVLLLTYEPNQTLISITKMTRQAQGVYETTILGDCQGMLYRYQVTNSGLTQLALDPYAKGSSRNSEYSVVINFQALTQPMFDEALPPFKDYQTAIIYEAHIRDLSSDRHANIPHAGSFLGAITPNLKSSKGSPIGFDYLTQTGITHLQILPVNDYRSVNEFDLPNQYNWGYDPYQFFALEGGYASQLDDPTSRIRDFQTFVSKFHQQGIRINVDVVFNHVYDVQHSVFEKVVPGYYFRTLPNGQLSNGSFCGNDFASEKPMVRKLIIDAAVFWVKTYHIDGFRFDLMGILDLTTLTLLKDAVRNINPDFMLYGEGWDMPTHLPKAVKGITENAHLLKDFAFFNDAFRNVIKGGNFPENLAEQGYATGNVSLAPHLPSLMLGSSNPQHGIYKVPFAYQSINYVQCHDNHTYYDKLVVSNAKEGEAFWFRRIIFTNALILLASGIPFFHAGQELGNTKGGDHNSFQSGDKVNQFNYQLIDDRPQLVTAFKDLIDIRQWLLSRNHGQPWQASQLTFTAMEHGAWMVTYHLEEVITVLLNPSLHQIQLPASLIEGKYTYRFDGEKQSSLPFNLTHLPPIRCLILTQR